MKSFAVLSSVLAGASAFPQMMDALTAPLAARALGDAATLERRASPPQGAGALPLVPPPFDAKSQYVSNQGTHKVCSSPVLSTCTP